MRDQYVDQFERGDYLEKGANQASANARSEGGSTAMVIIALMFAAMAFALVAGRMLFERDAKEDMIRLIDSKAKEASAVATVRAGLAAQDAALAKHDFQTMATELKKRGINIPAN